MKALMLSLTALWLAAAPAAAQSDAPVEERDIVWARPEGEPLEARIYRTASPTPAPVVIDVHGGAWVGGSRTDGARYDRALAQAGFLVIAIDYRHGPAFKHPIASADVAASVRWVRLNADTLGADPTRIGFIGSSAGGHLALLAALRAGDASHRGTPILDARGRAAPHDEIDASVDYVIALWTPTDPLARQRYAERAGLENLENAGRAYFGDDAALQDASIPRIVTAGEADALPPILLVQAGADGNVPAELTLDLVRAYEARDGKVELAFFPRMPHAFGHAASPATTDMIALITDFAQRQSQAN
jgi:acetyl esterase